MQPSEGGISFGKCNRGGRKGGGRKGEYRKGGYGPIVGGFSERSATLGNAQREIFAS